MQTSSLRRVRPDVFESLSARKDIIHLTPFLKFYVMKTVQPVDAEAGEWDKVPDD
jgi:hypothetical protein